LNKRKQLRREETEWANKSKQNLPKNTHTRTHTTFTHSENRFSFGFFRHSFLRRAPNLPPLQHPLTSSMTRETKLCYLHLPLWLFGIKPVSPFLSLFNAPFILRLSVCLSFCLSLLVPLNRAKLVLSAQSKLVSANCNELIPFQFSAKNKFHAITQRISISFQLGEEDSQSPSIQQKLL